MLEQNMYFVIGIIAIGIIYIYLFNKENFEVVSSNEWPIPEYPVDSLYDIETKTIGESIVANGLIKSTIITPDYTLFNSNLHFSFLIPFKMLSMEKITKILPMFFNKSDRIVAEDISGVYFKDVGKDRDYIFNVKISNITKFFNRSFKVLVNVKNIEDFLTKGTVDTHGTFKENITEEDIYVNSTVQGASLDDTYFPEESTLIKSEDEFNSPYANYQQTTRPLYLLDNPFKNVDVHI